MAHCGFEPTAINDTFAHPLKALRVSMRGPRVEGPMALDPLQMNNGSQSHADKRKPFPVSVTVEHKAAAPASDHSHGSDN